MKALSVIGLLFVAAIIATVPVSPQVTSQGIELRIDQAQAQYGRARRVARRVVYGGAYYRYDPSYGYGYVVPNYGHGYPVDGYGGYPASRYGYSYPSYSYGYSYPSYGYGYYGGYGPRIRIGWGRGWW